MLSSVGSRAANIRTTLLHTGVTTVAVADGVVLEVPVCVGVLVALGIGVKVCVVVAVRVKVGVEVGGVASLILKTIASLALPFTA